MIIKNEPSFHPHRPFQDQASLFQQALIIEQTKLVRVQDIAGKELEQFFQKLEIMGVDRQNQPAAGAQALGQGIRGLAQPANMVNNIKAENRVVNGARLKIFERDGQETHIGVLPGLKVR